MAIEAYVPIPLPTTKRGPGCTDACVIVTVLVPGLWGRREALMCDRASHEAYGRTSANLDVRTEGLVCRTGGLVIDHRALTVSVDGREISVTRRECQILLYLSGRLGRTCSHSEMGLSIWHDDSWTSGARDGRHALRVQVARLRAKLGRWGCLLVTVKALGYRLEAVPPAEPSHER